MNKLLIKHLKIHNAVATNHIAFRIKHRHNFEVHFNDPGNKKRKLEFTAVKLRGKKK